MKILIVDDDQGTLNALRAELFRQGHQVIMARIAQDALNILKESIDEDPVDFMVTDLRMPGMDGLDLIRRAQQVSGKLCAILMTAYGGDDVRKTVSTLPCCGYLEKPFTPSMLSEAISRMKWWFEA